MWQSRPCGSSWAHWAGVTHWILSASKDHVIPLVGWLYRHYEVVTVGYHHVCHLKRSQHFRYSSGNNWNDRWGALNPYNYIQYIAVITWSSDFPATSMPLTSKISSLTPSSPVLSASPPRTRREMNTPGTWGIWRINTKHIENVFLHQLLHFGHLSGLILWFVTVIINSSLINKVAWTFHDPIRDICADGKGARPKRSTTKLKRNVHTKKDTPNNHKNLKHRKS